MFIFSINELMRFLFIWIVLLISGIGSALPALAQTDSTLVGKPPTTQGNVGETVNGKRVPLIGATVLWVGTASGTVTDADGHFQLPTHATQNRLIISYVGYQSDTVTVATPSTELTVTLRSERTLQ